MGPMGSMMDYLLLGIGVYVLYGGIRGKGRLFSMEHVKKEYTEKFKKVSRIIYLPMGALMLLNGASSLLKDYFYEQVEIRTATESSAAEYGWMLKEGRNLGSFSFMSPQIFNILTYTFMGLVVAGVVLLIIVTRKMTDKNAPKNPSGASDGQRQSERQAGHVLPISAFEFDDETEN